MKPSGTRPENRAGNEGGPEGFQTSVFAQSLHTHWALAMGQSRGGGKLKEFIPRVVQALAHQATGWGRDPGSSFGTWGVH